MKPKNPPINIDIMNGRLRFPRQKQYIQNLNVLLQEINSEQYSPTLSKTKPLPKLQPSPEVLKQLITRPQTTKSTQIVRSNSFQEPSKIIHCTSQLKTNASSKIFCEEVENRERSRSQSTVAIYRNNSVEIEKLKSQKQIAKKQKMVQILSTENLRKNIIALNSKKTEARYQKQKNIEYQNIIGNKDKYNKLNDLRYNMLKNQQNKQKNRQKSKQLDISGSMQPQLLLQLRSNSQSQLQESSPIYQLQLRYRSEQKIRQINKQLTDSKQYKQWESLRESVTANNHLTLNSLNSNGRKQYLKKGSSINKNVYNSLLKLKLCKSIPQDTQKYVKNEQILNMIKVFKGFDTNDINTRAIPQKSQKKQTNNIDAWHNEIEDYELHASTTGTGTGKQV